MTAGAPTTPGQMSARTSPEPVMNDVIARPPEPGHRISFATLGGRQELDLGELYLRAAGVAAGLAELGVAAGDRIGIYAANCLEWVLLDLACLRLGAVTAGFEPGKFGDPAALRSDYQLKFVFTDQAQAAEGVLPIRQALTLDRGGPQPFLGVPATVYAPQDAVTLKFTSGSTGRPKALAASVGSIDHSITAVQAMFAHGPEDHLFVFLPLSLLQQRYWIYSALRYGHDMTVSTYEAAYAAMRQARPTVVMGVPGFYEGAMRRIVSEVGRDADAARQRAVEMFGDRVRYLWTGSAPARTEMLRFFTDLGMPIYEGYGLNETCIVSKNHPGAVRLGSAGRVLPGKQVILDADGVIQVRSEHPVARRYEYAEPGESAARFLPDSTVQTGDVGYIDDDGFLFILGRADEVIVRANGRNVVVRPIEERIMGCQAIAECVLFCPDGDRIVGVVSPAHASGQPGPAGREAEDIIRAQVADVNATLGADQRISAVVIAWSGFTVANGLLTSQFKPKRRQIFETYRQEIHDSAGGPYGRRR